MLLEILILAIPDPCNYFEILASDDTNALHQLRLNTNTKLTSIIQSLHFSGSDIHSGVTNIMESSQLVDSALSSTISSSLADPNNVNLIFFS